MIRLHSSDVDLLAKSSGRTGLTYSQLGSGPAAAETLYLDLGDVALWEDSANVSLHYRGRVPQRRLHLELWTRRGEKLCANGRSAAPGQALLALSGDPLDVTLSGPLRSISVSVDLDRIRALPLSPAARELVDAPAASRGLFDLDAKTHAAFRWHAFLASLGIPRTRAALGASLVTLSAAALNQAAAQALRLPQYDTTIVRRALDFMADHLNDQLSLHDVCSACGWSKRSMIYHFSETLGITPMAYFKLLRLNAVRRALASADPGSTHIVDVAAEYGFYHMGHFTFDYRALFGVLPSETLSRRRKHR